MILYTHTPSSLFYRFQDEMIHCFIHIDMCYLSENDIQTNPERRNTTEVSNTHGIIFVFAHDYPISFWPDT